MRLKLTILLFLLNSVYRAQFNTRDKYLHLAVGAIIAITAAELTWQFSDRMGLSIATGAITSAGITMAKERVWDGRWHRGQQSTMDELAGYYGAAYGTLAITVKISYDIKRENKYIEQNNLTGVFLPDSLIKTPVKDSVNRYK